MEPPAGWDNPSAMVLPCLALLLLACDAGEGAPKPEARAEALREGYALYDQVGRSYPLHDRYELEHQLIVRSEKPSVVLELLDLREGMVVGDVGCGSGFYTEKFARAVGTSGRVWALDIQPEAVEFLRQRLQDPAFPNAAVVAPLYSRVDDTKLPPDTLDAALLSHADFYVFPEMLPENVAFLASLFRTIKPGGALVVVQTLDKATVPVGDADSIAANMAAAGFAEERRVWDERSADVYLRFRKPEQPGRR